MKKISFRRKIAISLSLLAMAFTANAESLIIEETSGKTTSYNLGSAPIITHSGENLIVKTNLANAEFALDQVAKYYFQNDPTNNTDLNQNVASIVITDDLLLMQHCQPNEPVCLLSIDGKILGNYTTSSDGSLELPLSNLPTGIYIVKTNSANIKLIRK